MLAPVPAAVIQAPPPKLHSAGWLRSLLSVVMVQVADDGRLLDCNAGFQRLMPCTPDSGAAQPDIRSFFVRPAFDQLLAVHGLDGEPVFEGILNVVDMHGVCRSLLGSVHRVGRHVMVVAEYDVADMERLTAQVITLNQELAEVQRSLARANRDLRTNEARLELLHFVQDGEPAFHARGSFQHGRHQFALDDVAGDQCLVWLDEGHHVSARVTSGEPRQRRGDTAQVQFGLAIE